MCIDIVEIWLGIANGQILSNFRGVICQRNAHISFLDHNLSKYQVILTKFSSCIDTILRKSGLGLLMVEFHQILMALSAQDTAIFSFLDNRIFTKLSGCIEGLLMDKFPQCLTELSAHNMIMAMIIALHFYFYGAP